MTQCVCVVDGDHRTVSIHLRFHSFCETYTHGKVDVVGDNSVKKLAEINTKNTISMNYMRNIEIDSLSFIRYEGTFKEKDSPRLNSTEVVFPCCTLSLFVQETFTSQTLFNCPPLFVGAEVVQSCHD